MTLVRPMSRRTGRALSVVVLIAWTITMGLLASRAYVQARSMNLAADLARYGTSAEWRGVYYRGEKIGFSVSQMRPSGDGFELQEDARLQMSLFGQTTAAAMTTKANLDRDFMVRAFSFSLDPGTGPVDITGRVNGKHVSITIKTNSGTQNEERDLPEPPALSLNLPRRLAAAGFKPGTEIHMLVFDPATLRNADATIAVGKREIVSLPSTIPVRVGSRQVSRPTSTSIPAFRLEVSFSGVQTTSWVTDTGEVVKEESPTGLLTIRESAQDAQRLTGRGQIAGLMDAAAIVPKRTARNPIDDPRNVRRMRVRVEGFDLTNADMQGSGQAIEGDVIDVRDPRTLRAEAGRADLRPYLSPEPLVESDDPAIRAAAETAVAGVAADPRARAERLVRAVNAMIDKKPTVSLPSAREVLRTKVGDCNEHTALYVAMARALGIPSRIAVGLTYSRGAFYYHAWPEVYLSGSDPIGTKVVPTGSDPGRGGLWLPVDPTLNQFPADATHVRILRGGLDKQAAILPLIGHAKMDIIDLELAPNSTPVLVGRGTFNPASFSSPIPVRAGLTCWTSPSRAR